MAIAAASLSSFSAGLMESLMSALALAAKAAARSSSAVGAPTAEDAQKRGVAPGVSSTAKPNKPERAGRVRASQFSGCHLGTHRAGRTAPRCP